MGAFLISRSAVENIHTYYEGLWRVISFLWALNKWIMSLIAHFLLSLLTCQYLGYILITFVFIKEITLWLLEALSLFLLFSLFSKELYIFEIYFVKSFPAKKHNSFAESWDLVKFIPFYDTNLCTKLVSLRSLSKISRGNWNT